MITNTVEIAGALGRAMEGSRAVGIDELMLARALIDQIPDFLFIKDQDSRFLLANRALCDAYGIADHGGIVGRSDFDLHPEPVARGFFAIEQEIMARGDAVTDMEESFPDAQGIWRWYLTTKLALRDRDRNIVGLIGIGRDITERKMMERYRVEQGAILEMVAKNEALPAVLERLVLFTERQLEGIRGSILLLDREAGVLRTGAAPGLPPDYSAAVDGLRIGPRAGSCGTAAFRGETVLVPDIAADPLWDGFRDLAAAHGLRSCWSTPILSHDGGVLGTFAMYSGEVRLPSPTETHLVDVATRIAGIAIERQASEDLIRFTAHHDDLTGLPNRSLLNARLASALAAARRDGGEVAVAFVDLDDFKAINDGLGHSGGDEVLRVTAARMVAALEPEDSVVRIGGDEFVAILPWRPGLGPALDRIRHLDEAICRPVAIAGRDVRITCSMGIARFPRDGADPDTLLTNADDAMYVAKEAGRNNRKVYDSCMNAEKRHRAMLVELMHGAIERGEMHLLYQPQVAVDTGRIFAVEALLRWNHPGLGLIPPATFVPIAEASGLIGRIGDWVLETACRQNRAWQQAGGEAITVSVNVSARQFMDRDWAATVGRVLAATGLEARYLDLEVTESMLMRDVGRAVATMRELRALGAQLSIDDFGTGYSNLSALKRFPVGRLKIDQSFVRDLASDENDRAIACAVISLGRSLGLRIIAEGVETVEQVAFLTRHGCDEVQGYHFGRPMEAGDLARLLGCREAPGRGAPPRAAAAAAAAPPG